MNRAIRAPKVRVIGDDGAQLGILDTRDAFMLAEERGLDLVEVSPNERPPVCKLMDYGRFKYSLKKKAGEARKRTHQMEIKEVKLRPKTDDHDIETKTKHVRRFLEEGDGVKLTLRFRGREIIYADKASELLLEICQAVGDIGQVRQQPILEGRNMSMVVVPRKEHERGKSNVPES